MVPPCKLDHLHRLDIVVLRKEQQLNLLRITAEKAEVHPFCGDVHPERVRVSLSDLVSRCWLLSHVHHEVPPVRRYFGWSVTFT